MDKLNRIDKYININKFFISIVGLWPYQLSKEKIILRSICIGTLTSFIIPLALAAYEVRNQSTIFVEYIPPLFTGIGGYICGISLMMNMSKMKLLSDCMKNDWQSNLSECELDIIGRAAQKGKHLTLMFAIYVYVTVVLYVMIPLMPQFFDIIIPLNESRSRFFIFQPDYIFFENNNHYYFIYAHSILATLFTVTTILSSDISFLCFVQHACGMFQLLGYRLRNITDKNFNANQNEVTQDEEVNKKLIGCIQLYNNILQFADNIEHCFSNVFILAVGINMLMISFQGLQIVLNLNNIPLLLRLVAFFISQIIHLYFNTIPGQALIDESSKVSDYCYKCNWTNMQTNSQKLLLFMLLRASRECKVSAGKFYIISMENFSAVIKTSFSYLSVLTSAQ